MFRWKQGSNIEVAGHSLAGDDLMLKRGFKGDEDVFQSSVSEDGKIMVVLDTRQDEKVDGAVISLVYVLYLDRRFLCLGVLSQNKISVFGVGLTR